MYSQAFDIYIDPLISSSKSVLKLYIKNMGRSLMGCVKIDITLLYYDHIILDWTSVKTIKNSLHLTFFLILSNNFYLVLMENESIGVEHI